jgi:inner membrane protein
VSLLIATPLAGLLAVIATPAVGAVFLMGALGGTGIPDLDQKTSLVKHRGWTHTIWFSTVLTIVSFPGYVILFTTILPPEILPFVSASPIVLSSVFAIGMGFGVLSHLLGDVITPMGIRPFSPLTPRQLCDRTPSEKKYVFEIAKASNRWLNQGALGVGILVALGVLYITSTII